MRETIPGIYARNLADRCGRQGSRGFAHFHSTAAGSPREVDVPLLVARDLIYVPEHKPEISNRGRSNMTLEVTFLPEADTGSLIPPR